jgi:DNA (cytosine-5)-methyltransferase 1
VLDAQYFGVAQRRRRVFVVGCLGDWRPPAEVLFESESLSGNPKPSRKTRQSVAGYVESSFGQYREDVIAGTTKASGGVLSGGSETFIVGALDTECGGQKLSHQSINSGHIFAVYENHPSDSRVREMGDVCQTVTSTWGSGGGNIPFVQNIAYEWHNQDSRIKPIKVAATLNCNAGGREGHLVQSVAYGFEPGITKREGNPNRFTKEISPTLRAEMGDNQVSMANSMAVRRLTPVECERLQGFPDNYTNIKENCPDGARYKALGNSMAVPVMRWIGERINSYETMRSSAVVQVETGMGLAEV